MQLPLGTRFKLYAELVDENEQDDEAFLELSQEEQARTLLSLLPEEVDSGYLVKAVALPTRSKSAKKNKKRMKRFAQKVQRLLNEAESTHSRLSVAPLEGHGILITGYRAPQPPQLPFPFGLGAPQAPVRIPPGLAAALAARMTPPENRPDTPKPADSALADHDRERLIAICNQAFVMLKLTNDDTILKKNLDELMDSVLKGIGTEMTKSFISEIERFMTEHRVQSTGIPDEDHDDCMLMKAFTEVKGRFEKHVQFGTN